MSSAISPSTTNSTTQAATGGTVNELPATVSLHRSLMGSLRANSPFKGTALASQSAENLKASQNATSILIAVDGTPFQLPDFERTINLACSANYDTDRVRIFEQCLHIQPRPSCRHRFFALPALLRLHIYDYCFHSEPRKITLSAEFATKAAFDSSFFAQPFDVLDDILGGLHSFQALRNEIYVYFWTQHHFHITLSHFTTQPFFSPLSRIWVIPYLSIVQFLTVELDLTKFGMGVFLGAADYGNNVETVEDMFDEIIVGLSKREGYTIMMELNLLCRRYAGFRPPALPLPEDQPDGFPNLTPYCPELATLICDSVGQLRGYLQHCRLAGFTQQYAEKMLTAVFGDDNHKHKWYNETEPAWSAMPETGTSHAVIPHSRITRPAIPIPSKNKYSSRLWTPRNFITSNLRRAFTTSTPPTPTARRLRSEKTPQPQAPTQKATAKISPLASIMIPLLSTLNGPTEQASPKSIVYSSLSEGPSLPQTPDTPFLPLFGPQTSITGICPDYKLRLTRSRSFQDDLEEHLRHSFVMMPQEDASMTEVRLYGRDLPRVTHPSSITATSSSRVFDGFDNEETQTPKSISRSSSFHDSPNESTVLPPISETRDSHDGLFTTSTDQRRTIPRRVSSLPKTVKTISPQNKEIVTPDRTKDVLSPLRSWKRPPLTTPSKRSRTPVPSSHSPKYLVQPALSNTQNSPNTMNNLNEQDPAFLRTMRAMQSFSEPTRQVSGIAHPVSLQPTSGKLTQGTGTSRPLISMNVNNNGTHRKKYLTFVSKLRGTFERQSE